MQTALDTFAYKHLISPALHRRMQTAAEELITQLISRPGLTDLDLSISFLEKEERANLSLTWEGEGWNPLESGDAISAKLLLHAVHDLNHTYEGGINHMEGWM